MKIINLILSILFILFAWFQLNDPDPWLWVALYIWVAIVCGMAVFSKYSKYLILGGIIASVLGVVFLLPEFIYWIQMGMPTITGSMKAEAPHIEYTREFLGLGICLGVFIFQYFQQKKVKI